jgi:hypothetical protein
LLLLHTEHKYPSPFFDRNTVHFTCTATNFPVLPTTTSKFSESPNGLQAGNPRSAASAINFNSTHSPRFFLSAIFGFDFFNPPPQKMSCHPDQAVRIGASPILQRVEGPAVPLFRKSTRKRPKHKRRKPKMGLRRCFSLYIQNIKSKGGNRTFFEIYISRWVNELGENGFV